MSKIKFYPFNDRTPAFTPEPIPATKNVPDWYKKMPSDINEEMALPQGTSTSTVKRCMPIFDAITAGYILSLPCDIYVDATNPAKLTWSIPNPLNMVKNDLVSSHSREQYSTYPIDEKRYHRDLFRIMPFWAVETEEGHSILVTHPIHRDPSPLYAISGIVDSDRFIVDGHFSFLVEKDFKGVLKQGMPLVQVIPFKRDDYEMELVDPIVANKLITKQRLFLRSTFKFGYKNKMRAKKDYK